MSAFAITFFSFYKLLTFAWFEVRSRLRGKTPQPLFFDTAGAKKLTKETPLVISRSAERAKGSAPLTSQTFEKV